MISEVWHWLTDPANWSGSDSIGTRLVEHTWYSLAALAVAALIAIPAGLVIGHSGRGRFAVINLAGAARAIPSMGLLFVMVLWLFPKFPGDAAFIMPMEIILVVLAIPPILAGAYAGVEGVDPAARDAAKGMGMSGAQVLGKVELPCALPLIFSGLRSAALQVIATATIAAYTGAGGLGRFIFDGLKVQDLPQMVTGALLVALLALLADGLFALVQRYAVSPGLTGRGPRHARGGPAGIADANTPQDVELRASRRTVDAQPR